MPFTSQNLKDRFFRAEDHPYRILENAVGERLKDGGTILDAGCGHSADVLKKFSGRAGRLIGVDLVDFDQHAISGNIELYNADLEQIPVDDACVDLLYSRSVFEHLERPLPVYQELNRVLKKGGQAIILTPNLGDYTAWVSKLVPNQLHPWIVAKTEGRNERDTFPAFYRSNTARSIRKLAAQTQFEVVDFRYLGQYPCYFMFNPVLFLLATGYEKMISRFDSLKYLRGWIMFTLRKI